MAALKDSVTVYILCILSGLALAGETTCPDGWLGFQGSCYLFGQNGVHFTEAEHFCRQHGDSHLIHLDDKAENEFIKSKLRELNRNIWWIGMTDELVEGIWTWTDTDRTLNFTDFEPSEGTTDAEDCGVFWPPFNFRWADISCTADNYPICKMKGRTSGCACANTTIMPSIVG